MQPSERFKPSKIYLLVASASVTKTSPRCCGANLSSNARTLATYYERHEFTRRCRHTTSWKACMTSTRSHGHHRAQEQQYSIHLRFALRGDHGPLMPGTCHQHSNTTAIGSSTYHQPGAFARQDRLSFTPAIATHRSRDHSTKQNASPLSSSELSKNLPTTRLDILGAMQRPSNASRRSLPTRLAL